MRTDIDPTSVISRGNLGIFFKIILINTLTFDLAIIFPLFIGTPVQVQNNAYRLLSYQVMHRGYFVIENV